MDVYDIGLLWVRFGCYSVICIISYLGSFYGIGVVVFVDEHFTMTNWQTLTVSQWQTLTMFTTMNMNALQQQTWCMFVTQPFMSCKLCLRHLLCYEPLLCCYPFPYCNDLCLETQTNPLSVVLLPKKGANKLIHKSIICIIIN